ADVNRLDAMLDDLGLLRSPREVLLSIMDPASSNGTTKTRGTHAAPHWLRKTSTASQPSDID
ncbi:MAG TPA: hypothetical protein VFW73_02520, partial [Lacipirellulaceae bacterium]|nr:hypothetical protein [Lacipirellulaceae bacterium]